MFRHMGTATIKGPYDAILHDESVGVCVCLNRFRGTSGKGMR
jgi:hypothetical protein